MDSDSVRLVLTTVPDAVVGERVARTLVGERLAACVTRIPGATSCYRWEGEVRSEAEEVLFIKTAADRLTAAEARLRELHPYASPEWLVLPVAAGAAAYLDWVRAETRDPSAEGRRPD